MTDTGNAEGTDVKSTSRSFQLNVNGVNDPPVIQLLDDPNKTVLVGEQAEWNFVVIDPDSDPGGIKIYIDPNPPPFQFSIVPNPEPPKFSIRVTPDTPGTFPFVLHGKDEQGATASADFLLTALPGVFIEDAIVFEDQPQLFFRVALTFRSEKVVTVEAFTLGMTAFDPIDYIRNRDLITFEPGQTEKFFKVQVLEDEELEGHQFFEFGIFSEKLYYEYLDVLLTAPVNAVIKEAPDADMLGNPYRVGKAKGYIVDNDVSESAQAGHVFEVPCSEIRVELLSVSGSVVKILPPSADDPCRARIELVGDGSATFQVDDGNRRYFKTLYGPGKWRVGPANSVVIESEEGLAVIQYELGDVVHDVQVASGGSVKLSDMSDATGAFQSVEVTAGGVGGSVVVDGFVLVPGVPVLTITASIDIKPGTLDNTVNLSSQGTLPVAILSSSDFDAPSVDAASVTLAGAVVKIRRNGTPLAASEDVNGDGLLDVVVHILTSELQIGEGETRAVLTAMDLTGGIILRGSDTISVVR
ncbi:MAG: hypothetical protein HY735_14050 [Verrucomicrobia bacterium]|nr:hypothetical protein [Verrucomicrobiota bacterium]